MIIFDKMPKSTMYQTPDKLMENTWYAWYGGNCFISFQILWPRSSRSSIVI